MKNITHLGFELLDNKNFGKMFSKYEMFSLDQAKISSDSPQIWYYNTPSLELSCFPRRLCQKFALTNWTPISTILIMFFIGFPIFSYPICNHTPPLLDILNHMPSQDKQIYYQVHIINLYTNQNTLFFKHAAYQKADSSRAASLSLLDNTVSNNSVFYKKCAEFYTKWQVLFHCHNPTWAYNHSYNLQHFSANFHVLFPPLIVRKIVLAILTKAPFRYTSAIFHLLISGVFSLPHPFSQFRQFQGTSEQGSLVYVRTDTFLISLFFFNV